MKKMLIGYQWQGRKKKRKKTFFAGILLVVFAAILTVSLLQLSDYQVKQQESEEINVSLRMIKENAGLPSILPSTHPVTSESPSEENNLRMENNDSVRKARFTALQERNPDIIGWLTMDGIDEAVVQKDNVFYLDHDADLKQNINGAFVDGDDERRILAAKAL